MADKKKKDTKKPAKKTQGGKKNSELSMDELKKVSGGAGGIRRDS